MFDFDQFAADCCAARAADRSSKTICEVVKRAVSDPTGLLKSLGEPDRAIITCGRSSACMAGGRTTSSGAE
jgi:hypothetical protein